jgi:hypothetical protein
MTSADEMAPDALRQLVREVLRDVLPTLADRQSPATGPPSRPPTSVPRSDSSQALPDSAAWPVPGPASGGGSRRSARNPVNVTFNGTQPSESHIHRVEARQGRPVSGGAGRPADGHDGSRQEVRLSTDAELHAFVLRVLQLADNPKRRRDILTGRLRFTLAAGGHQAPAVTQRVDKGAVTERAVIAAARAGAGLVLGPRAVLTPLARDKARTLGVPVEKER